MYRRDGTRHKAQKARYRGAPCVIKYCSAPPPAAASRGPALDLCTREEDSMEVWSFPRARRSTGCRRRRRRRRRRSRSSLSLSLSIPLRPSRHVLCPRIRILEGPWGTPTCTSFATLHILPISLYACTKTLWALTRGYHLCRGPNEVSSRASLLLASPVGIISFS